jgi:hypothetical protein
LADYHPAFPIGTRVRVADSAFLERFRREWPYHHPLAEEQLQFAGVQSFVREVSYYHGGACLYGLDRVPGTWHESCLAPARADGGNYPRASDLYLVSAEVRAGRPYVVVRDHGGMEYLAVHHREAELEAQLMGQVTRVLDVVSFEERYGILSDRERWPKSASPMGSNPELAPGLTGTEIARDRQSFARFSSVLIGLALFLLALAVVGAITVVGWIAGLAA